MISKKEALIRKIIGIITFALANILICFDLISLARFSVLFGAGIFIFRSGTLNQ